MPYGPCLIRGDTNRSFIPVFFSCLCFKKKVQSNVVRNPYVSPPMFDLDIDQIRIILEAAAELAEAIQKLEGEESDSNSNSFSTGKDSKTAKFQLHVVW